MPALRLTTKSPQKPSHISSSGCPRTLTLIVTGSWLADLRRGKVEPFTFTNTTQHNISTSPPLNSPTHSQTKPNQTQNTHPPKMQPPNPPTHRSTRLPYRTPYPHPQQQPHPPSTPPPTQWTWSTTPAPLPHQQRPPAILPPTYTPSPLAFVLPIHHAPRRTPNHASHPQRHTPRSNPPPPQRLPAPAPAQTTPQPPSTPLSRGYQPAVYTLWTGPVGVPGSREYYWSWAFRVRKREGRVQVPGQGIPGQGRDGQEQEEVAGQEGRGQEEVAGREQGHGDGQVKRSERLAARPSGSDHDGGHGDDIDNAMDADVEDTTRHKPNKPTNKPSPKSSPKSNPKSLTLIFTPSSARRADKGRKRDLRERRARRRMHSMRRMGGPVGSQLSLVSIESASLMSGVWSERVQSQTYPSRKTRREGASTLAPGNLARSAR